MKVPLADLQLQDRLLKPEIDSAIQNVIETSQFVLGKVVADFERDFAQVHGVRHCIAVGSGTDALHIALWSLGIDSRDTVVTTPFTFIATVEAISLTGARPLFVDVDEQTYNMDPQLLEKLLSKNKEIKAILPVHLYGQPATMDDIMNIAHKYGSLLVEDACQAHLAQYDGKCVGNFGRAACFSFYPGKNLGAFGEAGAVITNDDELAHKMRLLRDHGQAEKYKHGLWGHNYRMDGIQGAVLWVKLKHLRRWTERRREIAQQYSHLLAGVGDIILPLESPKAYHVYHLYVVRTKQRDALQTFLAKREISTAIAYPIPLHFQQAYQHLGYTKGDFPVSEAVAGECLSLPIFAEMTNEQVEYVVSTVRSFFHSI